MSDINWRRVGDIFDQALAQPEAERAAFLDRACHAEPAGLRHQVEELLRLGRDEGSLLNHIEQMIPTISWPEPPPIGNEALPYQIDADITLVRYVGGGGIGDVYEANHKLLGRVALKIIQHRHLNNPDVVRLFESQIGLMARLHHGNIVQVHGDGQLEGRPFFTMNFIDGSSLQDRLDEFGRDPRRSAQLVLKVTRAILHAHQRQIIHRDLKPANILLDGADEPHVTDLDLARHLGDALEFRGGTLPYMSPEQAAGAETTTVSDVYGLGAVLYSLLTGRPPFWHQDREELLRLVCDPSTRPASPHRLNNKVDRDLEAICLKCLEKDPTRRYPSAAGLAADLESWLAGRRPRGATRPNPPYDMWRWIKQNRVWTAVILVLLLGMAFFARRAYQAHQRHLADTIDKALTAAMSGDLQAAENAIAEAELAGASTGQVRMLRGQIALHRGRSQEAMLHLKFAAQLLPDSVAARAMLASACASVGDWEQYDKALGDIKDLTPSTAEDFLFKGHAEAYLEPERGLRTMEEAFRLRPNAVIGRLLRSEVRASLAQDTDDPELADAAVQDAEIARDLLGEGNAAALWLSLNAYLTKAGVHEHHNQVPERRAAMKLAGERAKALKRHAAIPEAVVYRWLYFREAEREEDGDELRFISETDILNELSTVSDTDHEYSKFCYALTLYRRDKAGDLEEALRVLGHPDFQRIGVEKKPSFNDRLLPFLLAEHDFRLKRIDWKKRAIEATANFAEQYKDGLALMNAQSVLWLLGNKKEAVTASKALQNERWRFYTLRQEPIVHCLNYLAGDLKADDLIATVKGHQWDQALAHYFIGMTKLAEADRQGALKHFDKVVKTRAFGWGNYDMSWVFLSRLGKADPPWPPWIQKGP